jgi:hypothetical protein
MSKILNLRERVHQPWRDALIRTAGMAPGGVQSQNDLFLTTGRNEGLSNLKSGAQLPNDSSFILLAARVYIWFYAPRTRVLDADGASVNGDIGGLVTGDGWAFPNAAGQAAFPNAPADVYDIYRLYHQASESIFWTIGAGEKDSLKSVPTHYLPNGGGLYGDVGGATDLMLGNNGTPSHESILRVARAITITPRQLIRVAASCVALPNAGAQQAFGTTFGGRDMLSVIDNLNAVDAMWKNVTCTIDGLLSRDVQ